MVIETKLKLPIRRGGRDFDKAGGAKTDYIKCGDAVSSTLPKFVIKTKRNYFKKIKQMKLN